MNGVLNNNIRNFRTFKGITQEGLATSIGKTKNVISNWERGDNSPDIDSVEKICLVLGVTPNQLFGWEPHIEYEKYNEMMKKKKEKIMALECERYEIQQKIDALQYEIKVEEDRLRGTD